MMVPLASAMLGALGALAAVSRRDKLPTSDVPVRPLVGCSMAIVLVGVDGSKVSKTIDDLTGGLGFSHAYFDPCQDSGGVPMVIGYTVADGVHWTPRSGYKSDRRQVRIELPMVLGAEIYGCVRQRIRKPLNVPALVAGIDSAATCVGLIVGCLPWAMQEKMRRYQVGPCISPNTIAAFFGVDDDTVSVAMINADFEGV